MGADATPAPNPLSWRLLRRLRTILPLRAKFYVSSQGSKLLDVLAVRGLSQPEFIFFELGATLATLSKKAIINKGPNLPPVFPNSYTLFCAPPKSGKTTGHEIVEPIRTRIYEITGINNEVLAGTSAGVFKSAVACARKGGLPLHCPDEGIASINSLLELQPPGGIRVEIFLSSGWSGADVSRAKATAESLRTGQTRLTLLGMGTLADISEFHRICKDKYSNRGLLGRFCTAYAPVYSGRCVLPPIENEEDDSLIALPSKELTQLLGDAVVGLYRQLEAPTFAGFQLADDALAALENLRVHEEAQQDDNEDDLHWNDRLQNRLLSNLRQEYRFTEMVEKWTLLLHLFELVCNSINFVEKTISEDPVPRTIYLPTVQRAQALVERAQEQDAFFVQVLRISTAMRNRELVYVIENTDFILYKCLRKILLVWPGPLVTSESFTDRCSKVGLRIPFDEIVAAAQALGELGSLTRDSPTARISCPGICQQAKLPRQSFRFFKAHPDLINLELLQELDIELEEYTVRYNMDYFQVVDAQTLRTQRSEKKFNEWVESIPRSLLPREENVLSTDAPRYDCSGNLDVAGSSANSESFPKRGRFQHENTALRFGEALRQDQKRKRSSTPTEPQHVYRLPGQATFTNHMPMNIKSKVSATNDSTESNSTEDEEADDGKTFVPTAVQQRLLGASSLEEFMRMHLEEMNKLVFHIQETKPK